MADPHVLGHLEYLWRVGYETECAEIGDSVDVEVAALWSGEQGAFTAALLRSGFLDDRGGVLCIHDLMDHAPEHVKGRLRQRKHRDHNATVTDVSRDCHVTVTPLVEVSRVENRGDEKKTPRKRGASASPRVPDPRVKVVGDAISDLYLKTHGDELIGQGQMRKGIKALLKTRTEDQIIGLYSEYLKANGFYSDHTFGKFPAWIASLASQPNRPGYVSPDPKPGEKIVW
jgi:hypothetical protein